MNGKRNHELPERKILKRKPRTAYQRAIEEADADRKIRESVKEATGNIPAGRVAAYRSNAAGGRITDKTLAKSKVEAILEAGGTPSDELLRDAGYTGKHARELLLAWKSRKQKQIDSRLKDRSV